MKNIPITLTAAALAALASASASAETMDRPTGFRIGQRMTLRPYVAVSATYDSNVCGWSRGGSGKTDDVMWTVNPGFSLEYNAESWALLLTAYYNYRAYCQKRYWDNYNRHSFGETLRWNWSNTKGNEKGWSLMLSERFQQTTMADDVSLGNGRAYTGDYREFSIQGVAQRRFNESWHSELMASYYNIDYDQDDYGYGRYGGLFGWQRWTGNLSLGYAPSKWTDFLANVGYQGYQQDNVSNSRYSRSSQGYTAQFGIGSYATERISYRALFGWSRFEYANGASANDGFVYTLSGKWLISDTLSTMFVATSYYQPSEREMAARSRVDSVSWGLGKALVRGKLRATLDCTYRRETHEYVGGYYDDYRLDVASARLGLDYTLNRFLALFAYAEYMKSWNDNSRYLDYDRWRVTGGVRFTY